METLKITTTYWIPKFGFPRIRVKGRGSNGGGIYLPAESNNIGVFGEDKYEVKENTDAHKKALIQRLNHTVRFFTNGLPEHAKIILVKDRGHIKDWEIKF